MQEGVCAAAGPTAQARAGVLRGRPGRRRARRAGTAPPPASRWSCSRSRRRAAARAPSAARSGGQRRSACRTAALRRKWIGGRARSTTSSSGSPAATRSASWCSRVKWLASARTSRTGACALAEQALEAALELRRIARRRGMHEIVEIERRAVADHARGGLERDARRARGSPAGAAQ